MKMTCSECSECDVVCGVSKHNCRLQPHCSRSSCLGSIAMKSARLFRCLPVVCELMIEHYAGVGCFSGAVLHQIDIGLDQKLSMPEDSYVLGYFDYMNK